ncbi:hypothetical protein Scep_000230 [Stephania cephalantha]|uniref:Major facilitator superfamily (MFS) profile domain-containing protein n=1 Tax=Stephania cephalantha TaxID=152367 RepID=A0AAP0Q3Y2_9MAGN
MEFSGLGHLFVTVFLYNYASCIVIPAITDVTMAALCPGQEECSLAIYLTGFQQAITGLGSLIMTPVIGNLSDTYGRKKMLTLPFTLAIMPIVVLAYGRTRYFFYAYYIINTLTAMVCEGSVLCLSLAYVADNIPEGRRASAFGILGGVSSAAFVCGTLTARFLSTTPTFKVSAFVAVIAAVYMRTLLADSSCRIGETSPLITKNGKAEVAPSDGDCRPKMPIGKKAPSLDDTVQLLRSSLTFTQAAVVAFFSNLGEGGLRASLLYFLKAQFHFEKNQFANLMLIIGIAGTISQLLLMPLLSPFMREESLLRIGLFAGCVHIFLYSLAWSSWVPYFAGLFSVLAVFTPPCMRSIASKQVGPDEQGKAQGCISGICAFADIVSPLIFTPLTALFLSEKAPFHFPGFSIMCIGFALMIAYIQSVLIRTAPPISKIGNRTSAEA